MRLIGRVACWILAAAVIVSGVGQQVRRLPSVHFQGRWYFPDTDDYMRLCRVRMILEGNATVVRHIADLNPPEGMTPHWTCPMDFLILGATRICGAFAGGAAALEPAAAWTPAVLGGVYLALVMGLMRRSLGWGPALAGGLIVAVSRGYHATFQIGHPDHHCLIELFQWVALAGLWPKRDGSNPQMAGAMESTRPGAIISGVAAGLAIWVAAQAMLVWGALLAGLTFATYHAAMERRAIWAARRRTWCFSVLAVVVVAWLIEQWPEPARPEMDKVSLFHVLVAALALALPHGRVSPDERVVPRYALFAVGAAAFGVWFGFHRAAMSEIFVRPEFYNWSAVISELQPLILRGGSDWSLLPIVYTLGYLPFALPVLLPFFLKTKTLDCAAKATLGLLAPAITVLCALQYRWIYHFNLAAVPVAVIGLNEIGLRILKRRGEGRGESHGFVLSALSGAALLALAYPSIVRRWSGTPNEPSRAILRASMAAEAINRSEATQPSPAGRRAIIAEQESGPTLLYLTRLPVIAGPYHRALDGQIEAARFYAERDMAAARRQLERLGVRYVMAPNDPMMNLRIMERIAFGEPRSYGPSQYKIEDGELMEGLSLRPEIHQTAAMRLYDVKDLDGLGVRSVARAREFGAQIGERIVGFVYVFDPATTQPER
jgi:hypothetical protein